MVAGADEPTTKTMKLPLNATTIRNLDKSLAALPREALQQFADRVFTILYLECEHPKKRMEVNPDKEWDQSAIEDVDTALREILDPRGGTPAPRKRRTYTERFDKVGYVTLGHLLERVVESGRVTKKDAEIAMRECESEDHYNVDWAWDETAGPCLDRFAEIVKEIAANPTNTPNV